MGVANIIGSEHDQTKPVAEPVGVGPPGNTIPQTFNGPGQHVYRIEGTESSKNYITPKTHVLSPLDLLHWLTQYSDRLASHNKETVFEKLGICILSIASNVEDEL